MNILFLFEDSDDSLIYDLFFKVYEEPENLNVKLAGGAGNLRGIAERTLQDPNARVCVFVDLVPDNIYTLRCYKSLVDLSAENDWRIIAFPIVCAEYRLLQSLVGLPVFRVPERIPSLMKKTSFRILPDELPKYVSSNKSYEKYCKHIVAKELLRCCYIKIKGATPIPPRVYNEMPCPCEKPCNGFIPLTIRQKAERLIRTFPCVPCGTDMEDMHPVKWDDLWKIQKEWVENYNLWVKQYSEEDGIDYQRIIF